VDIKEKNLKHLKGVGESRQKLFSKLGIDSIDLLLCHYPRKYLNMSECKEVSDTTVIDNAIYRLMVTKKHPTQRLYSGRTITKIEAESADSEVTLTYFNNKYTPVSLEVGKEYYFYGKVQRNLISNEMNNPWLIKENEINKLLPIYPTTEDLPQS